MLDGDAPILDRRHVTGVQLGPADAAQPAVAHGDDRALGQAQAVGVLEHGPVAERDLDVDGRGEGQLGAVARCP